WTPIGTAGGGISVSVERGAQLVVGPPGCDPSESEAWERAGQAPETWVDPEWSSTADGGIGAATSAVVAASTDSPAFCSAAACSAISAPVAVETTSGSTEAAPGVLSATAAAAICDAAGFGAGLGGFGIGFLAVS